ncbi:MAG: hypothetical protein KDK70_32125, partial [Myxococcales bacterium]|nr:hypothetical protein [Myxococcales bacterium]
QAGRCLDPCRDCIPGASGVMTGQRNDLLEGASVSCAGRPCMRHGAVSRLRDAQGARTHWCDVPLRSLLPGTDPEARVSVWIRNDRGDALDPNTHGSWTDDTDSRVVLTGMAEVRGSRVTIEQEVLLAPPALLSRPPQSPDEGYGGGHNGDNAAVSICTQGMLRAAVSG